MNLQAKAAAAVAAAIARGALAALDGSISCVDCGKPARHYDHRDYKKPLEVHPVCRKCNARRGRAANWKGPINHLNMRIPTPLYEQLQRIAEREDQTMTYLARVFIKSGIDDRNRGARS